jgi:MoaA/NifB/PqqE/SkfB family radical SAM enzyme
MSNTYCPLPWMHMSAKTNGVARACCLAKSLQKEDGSNYRFGTDSLESIYNSPHMKKIRKEMLSNKKPDACSLCWKNEEEAKVSRRTKILNDIQNPLLDIKTAMSYTEEDGTSKFKPTFFDLRFGNVCNLKCTMCHPSSSNFWYSDYVQLNNRMSYFDEGVEIKLKKQGKKYIDTTNSYKWYEDEGFWKDLESYSANIDTLYFVGGEPMLIERHFKYLEYFVEKGLSHNITIQYDTNLTMLYEKYINIWKNFKKVELTASIDSLEDRNNYIRFPSDWNKIVKNISKVKQIENIRVAISYTWQILNAYNVIDMLDWATEQKVKVSFRILRVPEMYEVKILPIKNKKELVKMYSSSVYKQKLLHLINYLESNMDYENKESLDLCFETLSKLDNIRNTDYKKTFPELKGL